MISKISFLVLSYTNIKYNSSLIISTYPNLTLIKNSKNYSLKYLNYLILRLYKTQNKNFLIKLNIHFNFLISLIWINLIHLLMLKNIKIAFILELILSIISFGILMEKYTLVNGKLILMEKVKNQDQGFNLILENICFKDNLAKVKEMG